MNYQPCATWTRKVDLVVSLARFVFDYRPIELVSTTPPSQCNNSPSIAIAITIQPVDGPKAAATAVPAEWIFSATDRSNKPQRLPRRRLSSPRRFNFCLAEKLGGVRAVWHEKAEKADHLELLLGSRPEPCSKLEPTVPVSHPSQNSQNFGGASRYGQSAN
ncbi:hypothetical protein E4U21_003568 [Claviceps maximensis]|nr:hypothetical protein E4U21_003568 [Claviceps maximensis]